MDDADAPQPLSSIKRRVTAPPSFFEKHGKQVSKSLQDEKENLFSHPSCKIVSFSPKQSRSATSAGSSGNAGTLEWGSPSEMAISIGPIRIFRKGEGMRYLNYRDINHPLFAKSEAWCLNGENIFVLKIRGNSYYRIELLDVSASNDAAAKLKATFSEILQFEKKACPFERDFYVEIPDSPEIIKKPWKPKHVPNTPTSPVDSSESLEESLKIDTEQEPLPRDSLNLNPLPRSATSPRDRTKSLFDIPEVKTSVNPVSQRPKVGDLVDGLEVSEKQRQRERAETITRLRTTQHKKTPSQTSFSLEESGEADGAILGQDSAQLVALSSDGEATPDTMEDLTTPSTTEDESSPFYEKQMFDIGKKQRPHTLGEPIPNFMQSNLFTAEEKEQLEKDQLTPLTFGMDKDVAESVDSGTTEVVSSKNSSPNEDNQGLLGDPSLIVEKVRSPRDERAYESKNVVNHEESNSETAELVQDADGTDSLKKHELLPEVKSIAPKEELPQEINTKSHQESTLSSISKKDPSVKVVGDIEAEDNKSDDSEDEEDDDEEDSEDEEEDDEDEDDEDSEDSDEDDEDDETDEDSEEESESEDIAAEKAGKVDAENLPRSTTSNGTKELEVQNGHARKPLHNEIISASQGMSRDHGSSAIQGADKRETSQSQIANGVAIASKSSEREEETIERNPSPANFEADRSTPMPEGLRQRSAIEEPSTPRYEWETDPLDESTTSGPIPTHLIRQFFNIFLGPPLTVALIILKILIEVAAAPPEDYYAVDQVSEDETIEDNETSGDVVGSQKLPGSW